MSDAADDSDEDLKRAIAMSLEDSTAQHDQRISSVLDLVSDSDDDDDLDAPVTNRRTLATPTRSEIKSAASQPHAIISEITAVTERKGVTAQDAGFLGFDRRAMEKERLQRLSKRKADEDLVSDRPSKTNTPLILSESLYAEISDSKPKKFEVRMGSISRQAELAVAATRNVVGGERTHGVMSRNQQLNLGTLGLKYPKGVVLKTWVYGSPRQGNDIKIEEVLQKDDLELAVLSAFQIDPDWIQTKLKPNTKVVWVLQAKTEAEKQNFRSDSPNNYRFCFPSMEGNINCMHSKLQLLSHPTHLRVVVPSANLTAYDWGETGVMENMVFIIDLPRLPSGRKTETPTKFGQELVFFTEAMGLDEKVVNSLHNFDFSNTSHLAFVHSIGGSHLHKRTGYCGLGIAVTDLGLQTDAELDIDFLASSIGSLDDSFIKRMYLAAQGDDGQTEYQWRTNRTSKGRAVSVEEQKLSDSLEKGFRIYFPTSDTVKASKGGPGAAGTICFNQRWYDSETFPRHLLRDCKSSRPGLLMHSKMMLVKTKNDAQRRLTWAYVGSANLSESAWGRLVKDKATKEPRFVCRNWECGVVVISGTQLPAQVPSLPGRGGGKQDQVAQGNFAIDIPVPLQLPGEEYGERRPWFYGGN